MKTNLSGFIEGMSGADYHKTADLSSTGFITFLENPADYLWSRENPPEPTAAMLIGTAFHLAVLEPEVYADKVAFVENRRSKTQMADLEARGKLILSESERAQVEGMAEAVIKHPTASKLVTGGKAELSAFAVDATTGLRLKCRPDYWREDLGIIVDLKSARDVTQKGLQSALMTRKYHVQSAWYLSIMSHLTGRKLNDFVHLFVSNEAPYHVRLIALDDGSLDLGREIIAQNLPRFAECQRTGIFPGYPESIETLSLPHWAFQEQGNL